MGNKAVKSASPYIEYSPNKLSANEVMGFQAGKTNYQMNTPGGLIALTHPGGAGLLIGAQELASQHDTQRKLRAAKPGYEREARAQGAMARQQAIAGGLGGGGIQSSADVQAYNGVMAQYAALRQALEMARIQQQMQMYGGLAQVGGAVAGGMMGGPPGAAAGAQLGGAASTGMNVIYGGMS